MDPVTLAIGTALLQYGLPGICIIGLSWAVRKLYGDLVTERKNTDEANDETNQARKELDEARQDTIRFLEKLLSELNSKCSKRD